MTVTSPLFNFRLDHLHSPCHYFTDVFIFTVTIKLSCLKTDLIFIKLIGTFKASSSRIISSDLFPELGSPRDFSSFLRSSFFRADNSSTVMDLTLE